MRLNKYILASSLANSFAVYTGGAV